MSKLMKRWSSSLLMLAIIAIPAFAGSDDAKPANENAANGTAAAATPAAASPSLAPTAADANVTALLGVLVTKGVLAPTEAAAIRNAAPDVRFQLLVNVLNQKGVLTSADLSAAISPAPQPAVAATDSDAEPAPQAAHPNPVIQGTQPPPTAGVVPAITPLRPLPVDPPKKDGLNAAFKMGGVKMTPYGFIKATAAYDSSSPNGDDFPFVGIFLTTPQLFDTGPNADPEFHIKARSTRIGANFEFPDASPKVTITGKIEGDYEGNFSEADNRDVSSIRSNSFQLRLAWGRLDYQASEKTDVYFEGGQDWTIFGSSILPNILETTFLDAFYGTIYTRSPQFQFGIVQGLGNSRRNFKISPTFALMMPSSGQILKLGSLNLAGQLGEGEREGADSGRPEVEGRLALQFQLDDAKGVAPAQILVSGFEGRRKSIVPNSSYIGASGCEIAAIYCSTFQDGFTVSSTQYGEQLGVQLPTRWFTLVGSLYQGSDLRFFFGGQVNSYATDTTGLTNIAGPFATLDGGPLAAAGAAVLGTNAAGQAVIAPQRGIRSFGGFVNLGLPISRWFNADPKGRMAGWQIYLNAGKDQVNKHDLEYPGYTANANTLSPLPLLMGKTFAATLYYKFNQYVTFGIEQSVYASRLGPGAESNCTTDGPCYNIGGRLTDLWQDHRTEFGPIFSF